MIKLKNKKIFVQLSENWIFWKCVCCNCFADYRAEFIIYHCGSKRACKISECCFFICIINPAAQIVCVVWNVKPAVRRNAVQNCLFKSYDIPGITCAKKFHLCIPNHFIIQNNNIFRGFFQLKDLIWKILLFLLWLFFWFWSWCGCSGRFLCGFFLLWFRRTFSVFYNVISERYKKNCKNCSCDNAYIF